MQLEKRTLPTPKLPARPQRRTADEAPHSAPGLPSRPDPKVLLWNRLSGRQLGGFRFHRDTRIPPHQVDFVCLGRKLVVEIFREDAIDEERLRSLAETGYRLVRFRVEDVVEHIELVLKAIRKALAEQRKR